MSSSTPRETTGALPEWSGIQKTDKNMIIDPILQQYRAVMRAALQEHMNLVTSQYMTGYARASRESGIGAAMPMDPPNLSDISDVNPLPRSGLPRGSLLVGWSHFWIRVGLGGPHRRVR